MSGLSDIDKVYQGIVDLHNAEQVVSREALAEMTGLKMSEITKFTKLLVEHGKIYRVTRGIFKPAIGFGETRPVSVSVLDSGMGVLEIGDTVLHLNPQEMRTLGALMSGFGQQFASIQMGREFSVLRSYLECSAKNGRLDL
ncbi:TPA: hypothetical protein ACLBDC_000066 [Neisseria meningitidis]